MWSPLPQVHFIDIADDKNSMAEHEAQPAVDFSGALGCICPCNFCGQVVHDYFEPT